MERQWVNQIPIPISWEGWLMEVLTLVPSRACCKQEHGTQNQLKLGFELWFCRLLVVGPQTSHLSPLILIFLICKMGITKFATQGCCI